MKDAEPKQNIQPADSLAIAHFLKEEGHSAMLCEEGSHSGYVLFYVIKGSMRIDADATTIHLLCHDLLITRCPAWGGYSSPSGQVSYWRMQFSKAFLQDSVLPVNHGLHRELEDRHFKYLTTHISDYKMLKNLFQMIRRYVFDPQKPSSGDVCRICFNVMLHIINSNRQQPETDTFGRHAARITDFFSLIRLHIHREHTVKFYADSLCMTRGHLARILKENGNRSPKLIIETALADAAKRLLENHELTIYAIAEKLNFSSAASFTNFFKRQTQKIPSEYRQSLSPTRF